MANETFEAPPALGQLESATYLQCMKKANGRLEQGNCINNEKARQWKQLDLLYKSLAAKLNDEQRKELAKTQAAWKTFMGAETAFSVSVYYPQLGSSDLSVSTNEILWIVQRRQQLQQHLDLN
ncbi:lysozyme inhibitor LprI family protein [Hydrogenophaga sp. A37]|uniref:lysozyme inhibitor LprI family protein n=1 Tax=Hydrogenophaga sp. A37 TaxID=1945864 RepID=UPI00155837E4|nr:lysozyme inhibitor LprI family protein [Hydrogenophaga sp. A37]